MHKIKFFDQLDGIKNSKNKITYKNYPISFFFKMEDPSQRIDKFIKELDKKRLNNKNLKTLQQKTLSTFCDITRQLFHNLKDITDLNKIRTYVHQILNCYIGHYYPKTSPSKFAESISCFEKMDPNKDHLLVKMYMDILRISSNVGSHEFSNQTDLEKRQANLIFEQSLFIVEYLFELISKDFKSSFGHDKEEKQEQKVSDTLPKFACMAFASGLKCTNSGHNHEIDVKQIVGLYTSIGTTKCKHKEKCTQKKVEVKTPIGMTDNCVFLHDDDSEETFVKKVIGAKWVLFANGEISLKNVLDKDYPIIQKLQKKGILSKN